jgi:hypothetical protein
MHAVEFQRPALPMRALLHIPTQLVNLTRVCMFAGDADNTTDHTAAAIFSNSAGQCIRVCNLMCSLRVLAKCNSADLAHTLHLRRRLE